MIPAAHRSPQLARYYEKVRRPTVGPRGGARPCKPGCLCRRHGRPRHVGMATAEREGDVTRLSCARCGRGPAGTLDEETIEAWMRAHRHRVRERGVRAQMAMEVA